MHNEKRKLVEFTPYDSHISSTHIEWSIGISDKNTHTHTSTFQTITLKLVVNTVPCNTESNTTWSHRGPAFRLPVDEHENQNKISQTFFVFSYI